MKIQNSLSFIRLPKRASQIFFILCLLIIVGINVGGLKKEVGIIQMYKTVNPHQAIGHEFAGLNSFLKGVERVGYYTDKDLKDEKNNKVYSVAQYVLAPTLLEINKTDYEYTLFVCSNEQKMIEKIVEIGAQPLLRNKYGMILTRKPQ